MENDGKSGWLGALGALAIVAASIAGIKSAKNNKPSKPSTPKYYVCPLCNGQKTVPAPEGVYQYCPVCRGAGSVAESNYSQAQAQAQNYRNYLGNYFLSPTHSSSGAFSSSRTSSESNNDGLKLRECPHCHGTGICQTCNGSGWFVGSYSLDPLKCPNCAGSGPALGKCRFCNGRGQRYSY